MRNLLSTPSARPGRGAAARAESALRRRFDAGLFHRVVGLDFGPAGARGHVRDQMTPVFGCW